MKKALLSLAVLSLLFTACSKDKTVVSRESLVVGQWKLNAFKITIPELGRPGQFNLFDTMATCRKDDITDFTADHEIYTDASTVKCNDTDSVRTFSGNWKLVNGEADLLLTNSAIGDVVLNLNELDAKTMHLSKDTILKVGGLNFSGTADIIYRR